jgi:hypothetical protein
VHSPTIGFWVAVAVGRGVGLAVRVGLGIGLAVGGGTGGTANTWQLNTFVVATPAGLA